MPGYRKLGRAADQRMAILRNLTTSLIVSGKVVTTVARAKEVSKIAESLITEAIREKDNYTNKEVTFSTAKMDSKGKKMLISKTSKNGSKYEVVDREIKTRVDQVDSPSRLAARRSMAYWLRKSHDSDKNTVNPINILFNDVAPKYTNRSGGYTRIIKLGTRRGDASEMAQLELV
ncbi:MAG: 50S ribosomal protein L17 [Clostridiaceae bacterium]|jgi:large subunit ribosomal protein L17|nr:L17 family ribosomal protein [Oscillospiraceae bacterium]NLO62269.1 50S ribosomal protein L17 [Clostridiaceae bacterium]